MNCSKITVWGWSDLLTTARHGSTLHVVSGRDAWQCVFCGPCTRLVSRPPYFYMSLLPWRQAAAAGSGQIQMWVCVCGRWRCPRPLESDSDLFEESDDILAHVCQTHNHVVVVDVSESGVVPALPPGVLQHQIPAVHRRQQVLVFSGMTGDEDNIFMSLFKETSGWANVEAGFTRNAPDASSHAD